MAADPRLTERYRGYHALYEVRPLANSRFWLDWQLAPPGASPPAAGPPPVAWPRYPRLPAGQGAEVEGFVDLGRVGAPGCRRLIHGLTTGTGSTLALKFAPYGPSALLDGNPIVAARATAGAVLGEGMLVTLELKVGDHTVTVESSPGADGDAVGFYLVEAAAPAR